ncbi:hypothetical protein BASA60_011295 [Batrachochytrium salamandrivorans]|nr:hypothetical protein BASA60_011295 [Batrachochytrium salamandrivorans]
MKFSTGVILSMLSANVFAIEHFNDAHSESLLERRAVVADTDGPFLQKRNNGKDKDEQEEQAKSKTYVPNSGQEGFVYREGAHQNDPNPDPNPNDDTQEGPTVFPVYVPSQDDEGKGARKKVYAGLGSGRGKSRFANAFGESFSRVLGSIKKRLSRVKPGVGLVDTKQSALDASNKVANHFGGRGGKEIGGENFPHRHPRSRKKNITGFQDNVQRHIQKHISAIKFAIEHITKHPKHVISGLEKLMIQTDEFYKDIFKTKNVYPEWLKELEISDDVYLKGLEIYTKDVEKYKNNVFDRFGTIKKMVEDHRKNLRRQGMSKFLSSIMGI